MRADPDGYTILMGRDKSTHAASVSAVIRSRLPARRRLRDHRPGGLVSGADRGQEGLSAKDPRKFVAYVKANHQKLNMGHAGVGTIFFTTCLLLNSDPGSETELGAVCRGAPAMTALMGGHVDYMCGDIIVGASAARGRQHQDLCFGRGETNRRCRTCRPWKRELPAFQALPGTDLFARGHAEAVLDRLDRRARQGARRRDLA